MISEHWSTANVAAFFIVAQTLSLKLESHGRFLWNTTRSHLDLTTRLYTSIVSTTFWYTWSNIDWPEVDRTRKLYTTEQTNGISIVGKEQIRHRRWELQSKHIQRKAGKTVGQVQCTSPFMDKWNCCIGINFKYSFGFNSKESMGWV